MILGFGSRSRYFDGAERADDGETVVGHTKHFRCQPDVMLDDFVTTPPGNSETTATYRCESHRHWRPRGGWVFGKRLPNTH
ncbi:hypothetical protein AB0H98_20525, partial [Nocardia salmonicida]|uniref:hypothetical protein n=1 Tax=Nocardia salmonicida TaxID=53431 RepID=UPI0033E99094